MRSITPDSDRAPRSLPLLHRGVAAGGVHSCAITTVGVACRGSNWRGRLGNGTTITAHVPGTPMDLAGSDPFTQVTAGAAHTCATSARGKVYCWGANDRGRLGNGTTTDSLTPVAVG